jgi:hypothetical protein
MGRSCRSLGDDQWQPATSSGRRSERGSQADDGRWKPPRNSHCLGRPHRDRHTRTFGFRLSDGKNGYGLQSDDIHLALV